MFLSKRENGVYYLYYVDPDGTRRKISTNCLLKSDAKKFENDFVIRHRDDVKLSKELTLKEFSKEYVVYSASVHTQNTQQTYDLALQRFIRFLGSRALTAIGVRDVESFLATVKQETSVWNARRHYICLKSAFHTAQRWQMISHNPFNDVKQPRVPEYIPAYFTEQEFQLLLAKVEDIDLRELYLFAVSTGLRQSELIALRWSDLDLTRKLIHVQNHDGFTTKSKRNRTVPMSERVWEIMRDRRVRVSSPSVFSYADRRHARHQMSRTLKKYVIEAKLNDRLHFHSLRHTFATWLVQHGVPIFEVQKLLGHAEISTTMIYTHLAPSELHGAVNRIQLPGDCEVGITATEASRSFESLSEGPQSRASRLNTSSYVVNAR